jgi:hypothetical protein
LEEGARAYFRQVKAANAYFESWALGESRFIANANSRLTMQHRRAYQAPHTGGVANGHLVKRWTNEELLLPGQVADQALIAALCSEEGGPMGSGLRGVTLGRIDVRVYCTNTSLPRTRQQLIQRIHNFLPVLSQGTHALSQLIERH